MAQPVSAVPGPILAHIHVPKTGGNTVACLLDRAPGRHSRLYVNNTHHIYSEEALVREAVSDPAVQAVSSHFVRTYPPYLAGRRMLYFSFLREPVQQFISYLTYIKRVFKDLRDENLLACLPRDPTALSLRDFAQWVLSQEREEVPFRENYTVNFLARETFAGLEAHVPFDRTRYRATRLTLAKSILDQFIFVGLTERMDESVERLRAIAAFHQVSLPSMAIPVENTSKHLRGRLDWIHPEDEVGAKLFASVEEDRQLYSWAVSRFNSRCWARRVHPELERAVGE